VMTGALFVANRLPWLESRALERNAACYTLFVLFMLIPVARFLNRPFKMFTSAMIGWVIFVIGYDIAGMYFRNLFQVLRTPFEVLVEGAVIYGVCAVGSWVGAMVLHARHHPIAARRRRVEDAAHHHQ
jgi:TctA family transporter